MNNNPDLRVLKTKKAIKKAFINQIQTVGYDKITISSITKEALINRGTFYLHYTDKEDLLANLEQEFIHNLKSFLEINNYDLSPEKFSDVLEHFLYKFYYYCDINKVDFQVIFFSQNNSRFQNVLKESFLTSFNNISQLKNLEQNLTIPSHYLVSMVASIHSGITEEWLINDRNDSPEEIASLVYTMIKAVPSHIFNEETK